jgi:hypothetical protein
MSKAEILEELARLTLPERQEISRQLAEWEDKHADLAAASRAQELASGAVQPKTQAEVFRDARAALG